MVRLAIAPSSTAITPVVGSPISSIIGPLRRFPIMLRSLRLP